MAGWIERLQSFIVKKMTSPDTEVRKSNIF